MPDEFGPSFRLYTLYIIISAILILVIPVNHILLIRIHMGLRIVFLEMVGPYAVLINALFPKCNATFCHRYFFYKIYKYIHTCSDHPPVCQCSIDHMLISQTPFLIYQRCRGVSSDIFFLCGKRLGCNLSGKSLRPVVHGDRFSCGVEANGVKATGLRAVCRHVRRHRDLGGDERGEICLRQTTIFDMVIAQSRDTNQSPLV